MRKFILRIIEKLIGARFVEAPKVALVFEEVHLGRFLAHYGVDCVFDVGADRGQYATMLRARAGYKGAIISFEPIPAAAKRLREKAAGDPLWHVEQIALDAEPGEAVFNVMAGSQFSSLHTPRHQEVGIFRELNRVESVIRVEKRTLQEMFKKYETLLRFKRPFLKMDTQGNDLRVAEGAGELLTRFVGIQSELSIKPIYEDAPGYREAIDFYLAHGFELSAFVPNNEGHFPRLIETDCILYNKSAGE